MHDSSCSSSSSRDVARLGSVLLSRGSGCRRATEPWRASILHDADQTDRGRCPHRGRDLCRDESFEEGELRFTSSVLVSLIC